MLREYRERGKAERTQRPGAGAGPFPPGTEVYIDEVWGSGITFVRRRRFGVVEWTHPSGRYARLRMTLGGYRECFWTEQLRVAKNIGKRI